MTSAGLHCHILHFIHFQWKMGLDWKNVFWHCLDVITRDVPERDNIQCQQMLADANTDAVFRTQRW